MQRIGHTIIAVIAGVVVAFALATAVAWLGAQMLAAPTGLDLPASGPARDAGAPMGPPLFLLASWVVATFCGGIVAAAVDKGRPRRAAAMVGVVVLLATIASLVLLPQPLWLALTGVVSIVVSALAAGRAMSFVAAH